jgi:hypothetical protein
MPVLLMVFVNNPVSGIAHGRIVSAKRKRGQVASPSSLTLRTFDRALCTVYIAGRELSALAQIIHGETLARSGKRGTANELPSLALRASVTHSAPEIPRP